MTDTATTPRSSSGFQRRLIKAVVLSSVVAAASVAATPASAATLVNVIPTTVASITWNGAHGVLRAGSPWGSGSAPSFSYNIVDGVSPAEGTQWNNGSFWWDEDPSVNTVPVVPIVYLSSSITFSAFGLQADDNDGYALDYWDGVSWQLAVDFGDQPSFGLVTRPTATLGSPITTNRLRIRGYGGDAYYAVGELQGFVSIVPEPSTWAMFIVGFGAIGASLRRRSAKHLTPRLAYAR